MICQKVFFFHAFLINLDHYSHGNLEITAKSKNVTKFNKLYSEYSPPKFFSHHQPSFYSRSRRTADAGLSLVTEWQILCVCGFMCMIYQKIFYGRMPCVLIFLHPSDGCIRSGPLSGPIAGDGWRMETVDVLRMLEGETWSSVGEGEPRHQDMKCTIISRC